MWVQDFFNLPNCPPPKLRIWLQKPNNLGDALRKVCNNLTVNIIEQAVGPAFADELGLLNLDPANQSCYLRKVFLEGDGMPFTYGRVVVPLAVYLNHRQAFDSLGGKLIGETLLYGNPQTRRSAFEFCQLDRDHPLAKEIVDTLPVYATCCDVVWARRSLFMMGEEERILITEGFLEDLPAWGDEKK